MITKINSSQINEKSITGEHLADNLNLNNIILSGSIKNKADSPNSTITIGTSINAITTGDIKIDGTKIGIGGDPDAAYKLKITGNTFIQGDLNISGSLNYTQSEIVQITDNTLMLNSNWIGAPTENASIEVKRGTLSNTAIRWNESSDVWELTNDGTSYYRIIDQNYGDARYINADGDTMSGTLTISGTNKLQFDANNYLQNNSGLQIVGASGYIKSGSTEIAKWTSTDFYVSRNLYIKGNSGSSSVLIANASSAPSALTASSDDMHIMLTRNAHIHSNATADATLRLYGKNDTKYLDIVTNTTDTNVIFNTDLNGYKLRVSGADKFTLNSSGNAVFAGTLEIQGQSLSVNNVGGFITIGTASSTSNYISFNGSNIGQIKYTSENKLFELTDGGTGHRGLKASTIEATTEVKTAGQITAISSANSQHKLFIGARNDYIIDTNSAAIFITDGGTGGLSNSQGAHLYIQGRKQDDRHIMFSTGASSTERMRITGTGEVGIGTSTPSEKLEVNGNVKASRFISTVSTGTAPFAVNSTTAVTNLNSDMIDGLHATDIVQISETQTITGDKTFNANVYVKNILVNANGEPRANLGDPTIQEMALFEEQSNNKLAFYNISKLTFSYTMDGTNWIDCTNSISDTDKKKLVGGDNYSGISIPNGAQKYRIEIRNDGNYVLINALYMYFSSNSHSMKVQIWRKRDDGDWVQHTSSNTNVSGWPGHLYLPFSTIQWSTERISWHYNDIRIEFIPTWSGDPTYGSYPINLYKMQIWGGYPAGKRTIYSVDENKNTVFPATITATQIISNVATGTKPISVTSTTKCDNLNADMIDGYHVDSSNTANTIPVRDSYGKITANITGNADTATKLLTARKINNVSFDGTTDININLNNSLSMSTTNDIASVSGASFNGSSAITWTTFKPDQNINTSSTPQFARLGIGTAADSIYKLKISDGTITTGVADGSSTIGFTLNTPAYSTNGAKIISFKNNGTEKAYIDKDGTISAYTYISTASTGTAPLTVASTTKVTNLNADMIDDLHASSFLRSDTDTTFAYNKKLYFAGMSGSTDPFYIQRVDTDTNSGDLRLYIEDDANGSEKFSIWSGSAAGCSTVKHQFLSNGNAYHSGNLGIGVSSPVEKLEVSGNTKATTFISTASTGTAPLTVSSSTLVTNLNSDMVDGKHASDLVLKSGDTMTGLLTLSGDPTSDLHAVTKQYLDRKLKWLNINAYKANEPLSSYPNGISIFKYNVGLTNNGWPYTAGIVVTIGSLDTSDDNKTGTKWYGSYYQIVFEESGNGIKKRTANKSATTSMTSTVWSASSTKAIDDYVIPTYSNLNGYYYKAITAGTTGTVEPTWPTTVGATVVDGGVTWQCVGKYWEDWDTIFTQNTAGSGSGLDADKVDGKHMPDISLLLSKLGIFQTGSDSNSTNSVGFEMNIDSDAAKLTTFAKGTNKDNIKPIEIGKNYDGTYTNLVRINTDGKVGIGTNSPDTLFTVNGKARINGDGTTIGGTSLSNAWLLIGNTTTGLGIDNNEIFAKGSDLYIGTLDSQYIHFEKGSTAKVTIDLNNSRLGIGNTAPSYALDVSGDVRITGNILKNSYIGFLTTGGGAQAIKAGSLSITDTYAESTPSTPDAYIKGKVGIGVTSPTQILASAGMFAGSTPKLEILTGNSTNSSYEECVVIRHSGIDSQAMLRRAGLLIKLSNEQDATENSKMGGIILDSSLAYANNPELSLITNNSKRLSITYDGKIKLNTTNENYDVTVGGTFGVTNGTDYFYYDGFADLKLKYAARGNGGRAIVHDEGNTLTLNYAGDFTGGTILGLNVRFAANTGNSYINTGNVGIGTTSPSAKLHIYASDATGTYIQSNATVVIDATDEALLQLRSADNGIYGSSIILSTKDKSWTLSTKTSAASNAFQIGYRASTANEDINAVATKYVTILPNTTTCKFGINTETPAYALDVSGDMRLNGNFYWTPSKNFHAYATSNGQEWSIDLRNQSTYTGCYWHVWSDKASRAILAVRGDTERVGILTTNPTEALDVQGNIAVTGTVDGVDISAFKSEYDTYKNNILSKRYRYTKILASSITQGTATTLTSIDSSWTGTWSGSSIVMVIVNGLISAEGIDYTRSGSNTITFSYDIPAGSVLDIIIM